MIARAIALAVAAALGVSDGTPGAVVDGEPVGALSVIPIPRSIDGDQGHLHLTDRTRIVARPDARGEAEGLAAALRSTTRLPLTLAEDDPRSGDITLAVLDGPEPAEGYRLRVDEDGVLVTATSAAGLFYGGQTLQQLLTGVTGPGGNGESPAPDRRLPMLTIRDAPRYPWRGAMLDVARHFFGVEAVTAYIDQLAAYKVNRLHLHLTDDQGWRIEIPGWPALTAVGGRTDIDGGPGGWFTAEDYRRIVTHAATRHMTVVPEIDVPGHVNAALASYGELNPTGVATTLGGATTYGTSGLDPRLPATGPFITSVFTELAAMTPGPYIHVGGDEAFATDPAAYAGMIDLAVAAVRAGGKIPVGWEEIGAVVTDGDRLVQHWLDPLPAIAAGRSGAGVIASPAGHAYLDQKYDETTPLGLNWAGPVEVDTAYVWDPTEIGVEAGAIEGVEAPLWTETVTTADDLEYLAFPRVIGIAEVGWSDHGDRDLGDYLRRLAAHGPRLTAAGINFYRSALVDWPPA